MSNLDLKLQAHAVARLLERMREVMEVDDETVELTVASESDLAESASAAVRHLDKLAADIEAVRGLVRLYQCRVKVLEERAGRLRDGIRDAMEIAGLKTLRLPEATVGVSASQPAVIVTDEAEVPPWFFREEVVRTLDKKAVAAALKAGEEVTGCALSNAKPTLRVFR